MVDVNWQIGSKLKSMHCGSELLYLWVEFVDVLCCSGPRWPLRTSVTTYPTSSAWVIHLDSALLQRQHISLHNQYQIRSEPQIFPLTESRSTGNLMFASRARCNTPGSSEVKQTKSLWKANKPPLDGLSVVDIHSRRYWERLKTYWETVETEGFRSLKKKNGGECQCG